MRHGHIEWNLGPSNSDGSVSTHTVTNALLMDLRDEFKKLNRVLACPSFQGIPSRLSTIEINTRRPRRRRKKL